MKPHGTKEWEEDRRIVTVQQVYSIRHLDNLAIFRSLKQQFYECKNALTVAVPHYQKG
jgi:hypothetical protein